jgi:hypothetical protein
MKIVLLFRQCSPSIAENFTVTVRDMDATLIEKSCVFEQRQLHSSSPLHSHSQTPAIFIPAGRGK